jgi:hypothetical protein
MNCPLCNHELVEIAYGFPTMGAIELARKEQIALGGTPKPGDFKPTHFCYGCLEQYPASEPEYDNGTHTPTFSHNN